MNKRDETYHQHFYQVQNLMAQNTLETDKALVTVSIAALAALAALNEDVFGPYGKLSYTVLTCFTLIILIVTIGYVVSRVLLQDAQEKLSVNYVNGRPLDESTGSLRFAGISKWLNIVSMVLFVVGIILLLVLLACYIKGVK